MVSLVTHVMVDMASRPIGPPVETVHVASMRLVYVVCMDNIAESDTANVCYVYEPEGGGGGGGGTPPDVGGGGGGGGAPGGGGGGGIDPPVGAGGGGGGGGIPGAETGEGGGRVAASLAAASRADTFDLSFSTAI